MATLTDVITTIFRKNGFKPKPETINEWLIKETLRPFAMLDMGYAEFLEVDKKMFAFTQKVEYNKIRDSFLKAYRAFHNGFTKEELELLSDYEDIMADQMNAHWEHLREVVSSKMDNLPDGIKKAATSLIMVEVITSFVCIFVDRSMQLVSHDMLLRRQNITRGINGNGRTDRMQVVRHVIHKRNDYHVMVENLKNVFVSADLLASMVRGKAEGCVYAEKIDFDSMPDFLSAMNAIFDEYLNVNVEDMRN